MFFKINSERKIGYKELTSADLGLGETSNQTHIGLYAKEGMLSFLKNEDSTNAFLIYENFCDILPCDFNRIETPDGFFRSPKIRMGDEKNSVVRQIRFFASQHPERTYYLIWFGLDNNELVFWLLDNTSKDLNMIQKIFPKVDTVYSDEQVDLSKLFAYLEKQIDYLSIGLQTELEVIGQTMNSSKKFKRIDIEKAQQIFKTNGQLGENLINQYLEKLHFEKKIKEFVWENKSRESYKPFDFTVTSLLNETEYIDVKTTAYDFLQPTFFSDGEVDFITTLQREKYSVYRVFSVNKDSKFRICQNCFDYMTNLNLKIKAFKNELQKVDSGVRQLNLMINQNENTFKSISDDIIL